MTPSTRRALPFWLLALCFLGSGVTGLVYELVWTRRLQLTFGSTTYSVTTVLAAFMAGLGLGSYLVGRWVDRSPRGGVRIYALLELGIGLFALGSLPLLGLAEGAYAAIQGRLELGQAGATLLKFALTFPVMALPAGLMGGTLPALVKGVTRGDPNLHRALGRLYGVNTAGAALGVALAGLVLIEALGLARSVYLAATVNLSIGLGVLLLARRTPRPAAAPTPEESPARPELRLRRHLRAGPVLFCAASVTLTGFLSMLYEVVWTRMLSLVMGSSTYAFTLVLALFLVGLALGALIYGRVARGRRPGAFALTLLLLGLCAWAALTLLAMPLLPRLTLALVQAVGSGFSRALAAQVVLAAGVLMVPTLLLGAALPLSIGVITRTLGVVGRDVGGAYLANAAGAIAGSTLTGFLLIPSLGARGALLCGLLLNAALAGAGALAFAPRRSLRLGLGGAVLLLAGLPLVAGPWPAEVYDAGLMFRRDLARAAQRLGAETLLRRSPSRPLFVEEGVHGTVTVRQFPGSVTLFINGKADASTSGDMATQAMLGALVPMLHPEPRRVGVIGWGSGVSVRAAALFPAVQRLDVLEIEPAVVRASSHFHTVNGAVERDKRVRIYYDDARSHFITRPQTYDVIISEPSNPWMAGVSALYSVDFYRRMRARLRPGGVYGQWLQLYGLDLGSVALIVRSMLSAFPHLQLWSVDGSNVALLASDRPLQLSLERVAAVYRRSPELAELMAAHGPGRAPEQFLGCFLLPRTELQALARGDSSALMSDDHPTLEYRAVRALYGPRQQHMVRLWQRKLALAERQGTAALLPPGSRDGVRADLALAGGARMMAGLPRLRAMITGWGVRRFPGSVPLTLARAKALVRLKRPTQALVQLRALERTAELSAEARAEVALLRARVAFGEGEHGRALTLLREMGEHRPTARSWYTLRARTEAGRFDGAWAAARSLGDRLRFRADADALRLPPQHYYQVVRRLLIRSRDYTRALALLDGRPEPAGGELPRLVALLEAQLLARRPRQAAKTADQVLQHGPRDPALLARLAAAYRAAGRPKQAARVRALAAR